MSPSGKWALKHAKRPSIAERILTADSVIRHFLKKFWATHANCFSKCRGASGSFYKNANKKEKSRSENGSPTSPFIT